MTRHGKAIERGLDVAILSLIPTEPLGITWKQLCRKTTPLRIGKSTINVSKGTLAARLDKYERSGFIIHRRHDYSRTYLPFRELPRELQDWLRQSGIDPELPTYPLQTHEELSINDVSSVIEVQFTRLIVAYYLFSVRLLTIARKRVAQETWELYIKLNIDRAFARMSYAIWTNRGSLSPESLKNTFMRKVLKLP